MEAFTGKKDPAFGYEKLNFLIWKRTVLRNVQEAYAYVASFKRMLSAALKCNNNSNITDMNQNLNKDTQLLKM